MDLLSLVFYNSLEIESPRKKKRGVSSLLISLCVLTDLIWHVRLRGCYDVGVGDLSLVLGILHVCGLDTPTCDHTYFQAWTALDTITLREAET